MSNRISTRLAHRLAPRCGYRVVANGNRHELVTIDGQTVRTFPTKQQAINAGKTFAAMERTSIGWFDKTDRLHRVDYYPKGIGIGATRLLCTLLGKRCRGSSLPG